MILKMQSGTVVSTSTLMTFKVYTVGLERIRQWTAENSLKLNANKTHGNIFSRNDLAVGADPLKVGAESIPYSDSVRNLGLYVDRSLNWETQVSRVVSRVYGTLSLLSRLKRYMPQGLRMYLVRSLIVPIFLYSDIVYFPPLTRTAFRRLELVFNACIKYIFDLRYNYHVSEYEGEILGCNLFSYIEINLAVFKHRIHLSSMPPYLSSNLRFGPAFRYRTFIVPRPVPRTSLRNDSTIYRGIRLCNYLPSIAKQSRSTSLFKREAERYLGELVELSRSLRQRHHHHQLY
jgi:hypothetical protein